MQIGFTGTQQGMTERQLIAVGTLLDVLCQGGGHVHHGDCIGADAEFHNLSCDRGLRIEVHPPVNPRKRAFCEPADAEWPPYDYRERNQHIVNCADVLIATPKRDYEEQRSGTWMTVRMAKRKGIRVLVVYPEGVIHETKAKETV